MKTSVISSRIKIEVSIEEAKIITNALYFADSEWTENEDIISIANRLRDMVEIAEEKEIK